MCFFLVLWEYESFQSKESERGEVRPLIATTVATAVVMEVTERRRREMGTYL